MVITASHNPASYLGLKVKGAFGGSVSPEITKQIEAKLSESEPPPEAQGSLELFDPWPSYCEGLTSKVKIDKIKDAIASGQLSIYADVMHGAASYWVESPAGCSHWRN